MRLVVLGRGGSDIGQDIPDNEEDKDRKFRYV